MNAVVYEHPLNERIRTLLRLEHLFSQAKHYQQCQSLWDSRASVATLMDLLDVFARGDLKTEIIKEVDRATSNLSRLLEIRGVDHERLKTILRALEHVGAGLRNLKTQIGQSLKEDELLSAIRQRVSIPGGTCAFDLPAYHLWLSQPAPSRQQDQQRWLAGVDPLRQAVELLLKLIRNSAEQEQTTAEKGVYQRTLEGAIPYQLVRIMLPSGATYFPEVSGGKHRFTVRFRQPNAGGRASIMEEDVQFGLSCCSL